jgi:hypothetical protein
VKTFFRNNGLSIVLAILFLGTWIGQSVAGHLEHNQQEQEHGRSAISYRQYLATGDFLEATAENWESEFLQMFAYVILTAMLFQKGSAESKWPDDAAKEEPRPVPEHLQPAPVRRGGWMLRLYEHSLSLAFLALFLVSFLAHGSAGAAKYNQEQAAHAGQQVSVAGYFATAQFWAESLQNWQSEFLAVFAMVVLSIWLREKDSPESKRVEAPHSETGS